ncbi:FeoA family protein [Clostridium boliviensis]|uniref:FeoA family protein n=1 Tax=Clostridium boliviensis TaxID=318465 RepID=A0ABU4GK82_9CLOT|nr:FeoA family protein [Clostridium boliviensis]MDW2798026.1 FeoA family protein [Clostridium boliviensis]
MVTTQMSLNQLPLGRKAYVSALTFDGTIRRRMLDLGIVDGTEIEPLYKSPTGNPAAYLIRGAVIALRSDVSEKIIVSMI